NREKPRLPAAIPASATARIRPNVKVDPPSSGPSIRYHTSSIRKNAKPVTTAAVKTNAAGVAAPGTGVSKPSGDALSRHVSAPSSERGLSVESATAGLETSSDRFASQNAAAAT